MIAHSKFVVYVSRMVLKTYEILICHQLNTKFENQVDINVRRLENKLEREGFHLWNDKDPKRFAEAVQRSKVIVVCISRQAELNGQFNEKLHTVLKSGKPVIVTTVEPEYSLPQLGENQQLSIKELQASLIEADTKQSAEHTIGQQTDEQSSDHIIEQTENAEIDRLTDNTEAVQQAEDNKNAAESTSQIETENEAQNAENEEQSQISENVERKESIQAEPDDTKSESEIQLENIFPYLNNFKNFVICGKTNARTNVYKLMNYIKQAVREQCTLKNTLEGKENCFCWICQEVDLDSPDGSKSQGQNWNIEDEQGDENLHPGGFDEVDGGEISESESNEKEPFFVASAMNYSNGTVLLADANNNQIRIYDLEKGQVGKSSVGEIRGILDMEVLESNFVLVSQKGRGLNGEFFRWISILNEDLTEIKEWDWPSEIENPNCLGTLRSGDIAIIGDPDHRKPNLYSRLYFVSEISPRVLKSFSTNLSRVTSLATSPFSDVIAVASWRTQQVRLFDYKGRQLWFLIWKDDFLLQAPSGLAFLSVSELLLCDREKHSIYVLESKSGKIITTLEEEANFETKYPRLLATSGTFPSYVIVTDNTADPKFIKLQN